MCISVTTPVTPLSYSPFLPSTPSTLASSEDAPLPYFPYYGYTACLLVRGPALGHDMTVEQDRRNRRNILSCWYKNLPENPRMHPIVVDMYFSLTLALALASSFALAAPGQADKADSSVE